MVEVFIWHVTKDNKTLQYLSLQLWFSLCLSPPVCLCSLCLSWVCSAWRQGVAEPTHPPLSASITPRDAALTITRPTFHTSNIFIHSVKMDYVTVKQCMFLATLEELVTSRDFLVGCPNWLLSYLHLEGGEMLLVLKQIRNTETRKAVFSLTWLLNAFLQNEG